MAVEASQKTTALHHAHMNALVESVHAQYLMGLEMINVISKNLDFAQLKLKAELCAGPDGILRMSVGDIFAQAPVLLNLMMAGEKNMGHQPLVPYLVSFKPHDNGDIVIDVCILQWWTSSF